MESEKLKKDIYEGYMKLLETGNQPPVDFPSYLDNAGWIYCTGYLEDPEVRGKTYLAGKIVSRQKISQEGFQGITIRTDPDGIIPFEEYTQRGIRPVFVIPGDLGLVVNLDSLKANKNNPLMWGKSVEEIVKLNFACFPLLLDKSQELSEEDYRDFYGKIYSENPLFF